LREEEEVVKATIQTAILAAMSVAFIVACGKKSSDNAAQPPPPPPVVQPCIMGQVQPPGFVCINGQLINNPAGAGDIASGAQFSTMSNYISGSVSIGSMNGLANGGVMNPGDPNAQYSYLNYSGQVNVSGTLQILNPYSLCFGNTNAPAGTYSIVSQPFQGQSSAATIASGTVMNLNLVGSGGAVVNWQIYSAAIYRDYNGALRFGVTASRIYVNNVDCGAVTTY
jgi:hypothetical protein